MTIYILILIFQSLIFVDSLTNLINEDANLDSAGLLRKYGYPYEIHTVTTDDGYILTMHRIKGGKKNLLDLNKPPVFLMHGLLSSSGDWIIMGPDFGLSYILADMGYDVWMGNARGNRYSRKHKKYNPDKHSKFWDFSWNEIGLYDLPAMIDYILTKTNKEKLHYIGHSQGTTSFFVMTSSKPKYNNKILTMNALAPVAFAKHMRSPIVQILTPWVFSVEAFSRAYRIHEFLPNSTLINQMGGLVCNKQSPFSNLCTNTLFLICGFDSELLNKTMLPVIVGHTPAGCSIKQLFHYGQGNIDRLNRFKKYDYLHSNPKYYNGKSVPPSYKLNLITAPIFLHYGENDWLAGVEDVEKLHKNLKSSELHKVDFKKFNHLDFLYGINVRHYVYDEVIDIIKRYE